MRKVICLALMMILMFSVLVFADSTSTKWFHAHEYINKDSYEDRYNEYERVRRDQLGLGLDVVVYKFDGELNSYGLDSVEVQNKFDLVHKEYQGYIVGKIDATRALDKVRGFLGF